SPSSSPGAVMKKGSLASALVLGALALGAALAAPACGTSGNGNPTGSGGGDASTNPLGGDGSVILPTTGDSGGTTTNCTGLQCQIHTCTGGGSTTIGGTV